MNPDSLERHNLTLEALADVDTGNVVDHKVVAKWAESLGTSKNKKNLKTMLAAIQPDNLYGEIDAGEAVGQEIY